MKETLRSIPGYEILVELGRGEMGVVCKSKNLRYDRPLALKMILGGFGAVFLERARFRIEAETITSTAQSNIF